ncbi:MAG: hypothetical protein KC425_02275 [Anaerolineales bacterium]|nr:hypothetical protein [Anaerolineales bacterium]
MHAKRNELVGGLLLVTFGVLSLAAQFVSLPAFAGLLVLPAIALIFFIAGIAARQIGFLIPGGILAGIGLGAFLIEGPLAPIHGDAEGGIFLLSMAAGWALITLLSAVATPRTHWWPLIPGGIMALIGGSILLGGAFVTALELAGRLWPVILILFGFALVLQNARHGRSEKNA